MIPSLEARMRHRWAAQKLAGSMTIKANTIIFRAFLTSSFQRMNRLHRHRITAVDVRPLNEPTRVGAADRRHEKVGAHLMPTTSIESAASEFRSVANDWSTRWRTVKGNIESVSERTEKKSRCVKERTYGNR